MLQIFNKNLRNYISLTLLNKLINKIKLSILIFALNSVTLAHKKNQKNFFFLRLGSSYGGWHICSSNLYKNTNVLSVGAGEDISFDVELANEFGCKVHIFDPTPKAVEHFQNIQSQFGKKAKMNYNTHGSQDVNAYNLVNVNSNQISFTPKAVWIKDGFVSFFAPTNENSVSHTITAYNSKKNQIRKSIKVSCVDILNVNIEEYQVLKVDIEGAELPVLQRLIRNKEFDSLPEQILVEFDELQVPRISNFIDVYLFQRELKAVGFILIKKENLNFTFLKNPKPHKAV